MIHELTNPSQVQLGRYSNFSLEDPLLSKMSELNVEIPSSDVSFQDAQDQERRTIPVDLASPTMSRRSERRSSMAILAAKAIAQNNQFGGKRYSAPAPDSKDSDEPALDLQDPHGAELPSDDDDVEQTITINGQSIPIATKPLTAGSLFVASKRWHRNERAKLAKDVLDIFWKSATGCVLAKNNKLEMVSIKQDDEKLLFHVKNLQTQLKALRAHCYSHDIIEVFTIVVPEDVSNSPKIGTQTFDLFRDYATLHPTMVANSNAWYNNWVQEKSIRDNLNITFEMLRNNTETELWSKSYEEHEEFSPIQQGGPLILYFILKRIIDVSESSIQYLQKRVKSLKLTDLDGENVDEAVSLIKSTYKVLKQCSTDVRNYVPDDFCETVLKVLQTSSNPQFNSVFAFEEQQARHKADKSGGLADYPSVTTTCTLATNTYKRFTGPGDEYEWCKPVSQGSAFNATFSAPRKFRPDHRCFNCGRKDCSPSICTQPLDQDRIKRNADAWKAKHPKSAKSSQPRSTGSRGPPSRKKDEHGRPVKLNKNGVYVVDQQRYKQQKAAADITAKVDALVSTAEAHAAKPANADKSGSSKEPAVFVADVHELRAMIHTRLLG